LEVSFNGAHEWVHGRQMATAVRDAIAAHSPTAAVVINLLGYNYQAGDDISGLFEAFIDHNRRAPRPACIVATGTTYASMRAFFASARLLDAFQLEFVTSLEDAVAWLRQEPGSAGPRPDAGPMTTADPPPRAACRFEGQLAGFVAGTLLPGSATYAFAPLRSHAHLRLVQALAGGGSAAVDIETERGWMRRTAIHVTPDSITLS
jgi:hypothetical protein